MTFSAPASHERFASRMSNESFRSDFGRLKRILRHPSSPLNRGRAVRIGGNCPIDEVFSNTGTPFASSRRIRPAAWGHVVKMGAEEKGCLIREGWGAKTRSDTPSIGSLKPGSWSRHRLDHVLGSRWSVSDRSRTGSGDVRFNDCKAIFRLSWCVFLADWRCDRRLLAALV